MQQFVKFVHRFFAPHVYENRAALLWFVGEVPGYGIAALFAKCTAIFAERTAFSRQKAPKNCGALQDGALGHQSAVLLAEESSAIYAIFSNAADVAFVAFF